MTSQTIALFPLNSVLFPDGYLPLQIFEVRYLDMIKRAVASGDGFGVVTLVDGGEVRTPNRIESFADIGTIAEIRSSITPMPGLMRIETVGASRFRVQHRERLKHGLWMAEITLIQDDQIVIVPDELNNTAIALSGLIKKLQNDEVPQHEMPFQEPFRLNECGWVANRWAELLTIPAAQKLRLMVLENPLLRLELIQDLLDERGVWT